MKIISISLVAAFLPLLAYGQSRDVPVYREGGDAGKDARLLKNALLVKDSGHTVKAATAREQLRRDTCRLKLAKPSFEKLTAHQVWQRARAGYLRVGWYYSDVRSSKWRLELAGGYVLASDGAVGTSYHVVDPPRDIREGCLIAADDDGNVFPVLEILAANRYADTCIVRVKGQGFEPLALNTKLRPGDTVYCLSDPLGRRGYFSQGIVNRFFQLPPRRLPNTPGAPLFAPTRINVSADWSYGSSGAAVLDDSGNVIGQVCTIAVEGEDKAGPEAASAGISVPDPMPIVFHEAVSARDVLALIKPDESTVKP